MSENLDQTTEVTNPLEMSDEAFLEMGEPTYEEPSDEVGEGVEESVGGVSGEEENPAEEDSLESDDEQGDSDEQDEDLESEDDNEEIDEDLTDEDEDSQESTEDLDESAVDYKAEYERILAPFKANGREIQVDSVDDAISLMQQGANYNKKMAALKPNLRMMRMLENNELLDENKLNFLIDVAQKKPEAIAQLVKDSGIDPLDIDTDNTETYQAQDHRISDSQVALEDVLDKIKDTPTYNETVDLVTNQWDETSRQFVIKTPQIMQVINEHKQNGIYAQIANEMEKDRILGRLDGLSDLEAYRIVGDRLHAEGKFGGPTKTQEANVIVNPKTENKKKEVNSRKRAAASSKSRPAKKPLNNDFNPLSMSDEEFEKFGQGNFY